MEIRIISSTERCPVCGTNRLVTNGEKNWCGNQGCNWVYTAKTEHEPNIVDDIEEMSEGFTSVEGVNNNDNKVEVKTRGIGFLNILTLIFVIAKLFNLITWSWWLVLLPTTINISIAVILFIAALVTGILIAMLDSK